MSGKRMHNVNRIVGRDGVVRLYFRKRGAPSVPLRSPLPEAWDGSALQTEVRGLLDACKPDPTPGTLGRAVRAYELHDPDFAGLADSTKYIYRLLMAELDEDFGRLELPRFTSSYILQLRNAWAPRGHRAANLRLQVLKNVLKPWIIRRNEGDPFALIPQVRRPRDAAEPHLIWPAGVAPTVIRAAAEEGRFGLARGVAVGRWAGARRGDIVKMTLGARRGGRFVFLSSKRRALVDIPEEPELTAVLDSTPNAPRSMVLAYSLDGTAYTEDGFALELDKLLARLVRAGDIPGQRYTIHGLRHGRGVDLALAGCTDAEGAQMMGQKSAQSFAIYRRQADQIRLSNNGAAKMDAMRERATNVDAQNDVQNRSKTLMGLKPARKLKSSIGSTS